MNEMIIEQIKKDIDKVVEDMAKDADTFAVEKEVTYITGTSARRSFQWGYISAYMGDIQHKVNTYIKLMEPDHWYLNDDGDYECPCGYTLVTDYDSIRDFNYCPNCGCKMEVPNENE